jgi:hypothetical protein
MEGTQTDCSSTGNEAVSIVEVGGSRYFVVDKDVSKGDRRCDGQLMADFFTVVDGARVKTKRILYDASHVKDRSTAGKKKKAELDCNLLVEDAPITKVDVSLTIDEERTSTHHRNDSSTSGVGPKQTRALGKSPAIFAQSKGEQHVVEPQVIDPPRVPDKGIRCAGRNRTSRLLWLHEYFRAYERAHTKNKFPYIYQALQFMVGAQLPVGVIDDMSDALRGEIWVLGVCYIPAKYVRKFSKRVKGYIFHTEMNDQDSDKFLYGLCPEVVRLENCLKWHPMSSVSRDVPRIVHTDDIKNRRVYVAGRSLHFVCGVTAVEDLHCQEFRLSRYARANFCMYPEERSGTDLNSPSMMWEHIEGVFAQIRQCMRCARQGTSSASFTMTLSVSSFDFWKVKHFEPHFSNYCHPHISSNKRCLL